MWTTFLLLFVLLSKSTEEIEKDDFEVSVGDAADLAISSGYPKFSKYRLYNLGKKEKQNFWCIETFKFYDRNNNRISTQPDKASWSYPIYHNEWWTVYWGNPGNSFDPSVEHNAQKYSCSPAGEETGWIQYDFGSPTEISRYELQAMVHRNDATDFAPEKFKFEGSNDGEVWTAISIETSPNTWKAGEFRSFSAKIMGSVNNYLEEGPGICPDSKHNGMSQSGLTVQECRDRCERDFHETYFTMYDRSGVRMCSCFSDCDELTVSDNFPNAITYEIISDNVEKYMASQFVDDVGFFNSIIEEYEKRVQLWKNRFEEVENLEKSRREEPTHSQLAKQKYPQTAVGSDKTESHTAGEYRIFDRLLFIILGAAVGIVSYDIFKSKKGDNYAYNTMLEV